MTPCCRALSALALLLVMLGLPVAPVVCELACPESVAGATSPAPHETMAAVHQAPPCHESAATQVRDVMTTDVLFVRPHQTSEQCMQIMSNNRLRHLPVVENEQLVGMISIGDLVKDIISEQKFIIEQLEQYISGSH